MRSLFIFAGPLELEDPDKEGEYIRYDEADDDDNVQKNYVQEY